MTQPPRRSRSRLWLPWPLIALLVVTVANYVWQVPYFEHFYGRFGRAPHGLTIPLLLSFGWFMVGIVLLATRRRGGYVITSGYLVVEALFYLVHNVSGAFGRDVPLNDPVLLVASILGYVNASAAVAVLVWLRQARTAGSTRARCQDGRTSRLS